MYKLIKQVQSYTNSIAAIMLVLIFLAFCINIILRYAFGISFGWIVEFSLILWTWVIFLGAGIFLQDDDHVSFVYMYKAFNKRVHLILKTLSFAIVCAGGIFMVLPSWDYIDFLKIRASDVIGIPMKYIFIIYMIFLFAVIAKYGYKTVRNLHELITGAKNNSQ